MRRRFVTLDVFTDRHFAGNPLAVVLDAEGLETDVMQAIAREFNLAETVFVLPPQDAAHRARLRIFTPARELPFAGHPTIGDRRPSQPRRWRRRAPLCARGEHRPGFLLNCLARRQARPRPVSASASPPGAWRAGVERDHCRSSRPGARGDRLRRVSALALVGRDCVHLRSGLQLERDSTLRIEPERWDAAFTKHHCSSAYVYCRETVEAGSTLHARMFALRFGIHEDPATGSAAGALARFAPPAEGEHDVVIEQGYELGRPSLITLSLTIRNGRLAGAAIGGHAVAVTEGTIDA